MPNPVTHFAINADDVERARAFYEQAFGWTFSAWGPPEFFQIDTGGGVGGALQRRREIVHGRPIHGFECSIAVDDIAAAEAAVKRAGGRVVMERSVIHGVGELFFFEDTEGNVAGVMQYAST